MKLYQHFAFVSFTTLSVLAQPAEAQEKVLLDKSEIRFVSTQENVPVEGRFKSFTADVNFDPNKPEMSKGVIDIDLGSIDLNNADANDEVKGKQWFNLSVFPKAKFTLTSVKALGGGRYEAVGTLAIKGLSRDMSAPFTIKQQGGMTLAEGSLVLKRLDFKIGEGEWSSTDTVANDVQVKFRLTMTGVPQAK